MPSTHTKTASSWEHHKHNQRMCCKDQGVHAMWNETSGHADSHVCSWRHSRRVQLLDPLRLAQRAHRDHFDSGKAHKCFARIAPEEPVALRHFNEHLPKRPRPTIRAQSRASRVPTRATIRAPRRASRGPALATIRAPDLATIRAPSSGKLPR